MVDDPLVEAVGRHRRCRCLQPQLAARDEPHQITLACAVRAVALIELVRRAFDLERDLSAMTAAAQRLHGPDSVARGHTVCATRRGAAKSAVLGARIVGSAAASARSARLARRLVRLLGGAQVTITTFIELAIVEILEIAQGLVG